MRAHQYPQPPNEHAFEDFCLALMRDVWSLPTLQKFGRRGERQHGVDLLDLGEAPTLRAVQCKHHAPHMTLPPDELAAEVEKARTLPGEPIAEYWVLTTAKKSTATQQRVREINRDHAARGLFRVTVQFWEDIESLIGTSAAAQRHLELRSTDATLAVVRTAVNEAISPLTQGSVHVDLDEAKALLGRGELAEAQLVLRRTRSRHWSELGVAQKARWLTLSADALVRLGQGRDAAALLIEVLDHTPEDELALANGAVAKRLLDDVDGAASLAGRLRERFPSSSRAWSISVHCARTVDEAAALVEAAPPHVRESSEMAVAIACRDDLRGRFPDALERAVTAAPDDVRAWFHLGVRCLQSEATKLNPASWDSSGVDSDRLRRAIDALTRAAALCAAEGRHALRTEALLHRASAHSLLGDLGRVRADIDDANSVSPDDPNVAVARARLLLEERSFGSAIPILRELSQRGIGGDTTFMLASALWNRDAPGDRQEATVLMLARAPAERGDEQGVAHFMALDGLLFERRFEDAEAFLVASEGRLAPMELAVLEGRLALAKEKRDIAADAATRALAQLGDDSPRRHAVWVSRLLAQVGHYQEALPLLRRLAENDRDVDSVRAFVLAASRLGRHAEVLAACARARAAGTDDPYLLSVELPLLDRYDPTGAVTLLEDVLRRHPEQHGARVHLVLLAQRIGRTEIVERELGALPTVAVVDDAEEGAAVVRALQTAGRHGAAQAYAYDLLRRFFTSPHAHRALIHSVLWRDKAGEDEAEPTSPVVAPGTAVRLAEPGGSEHRWFVLEDSTVTGGALEDELTSSHDLWARLMGRRVGEQVDLGSGPGLARRVRVVEVLPKVTYRFRDAMNRWQYRFAAHQELWMVRVCDDATGAFDSSPLLEMARAQHERVKHVEAVYREQRVPIAMLGEAVRADVIGATLHAATTPRLPVRCCLGSVQEREAAFRALDAAGELVLDGTAFATLYLLDLVGVLRATGKRVLVPHALMALLRAFVDDARATERASAQFVATGDGPVFHVFTEDGKKAFRERAAAFVAGVECIATITSSMELAAMNVELRGRLGEALDETTLDALAVSTAPGRVLWTDDHVVGQIGRSELGTISVWTQAMLLWLLHRGLLGEEDYTGASAKLVAFGYTFTSLSPAVLAHAGRLARWAADAWPLREGIAQLGQPDVRPEDGAQLGALLVRDAFTEPLPVETRQAVLFAVCTALAARADGDRTMAAFERLVRRVFGLNAVGEQQALAALLAWKASPRLVLTCAGAARP
jgi:tetratricopeptide (TPR) repeat protein